MLQEGRIAAIIRVLPVIQVTDLTAAAINHYVVFVLDDRVNGAHDGAHFSSLVIGLSGDMRARVKFVAVQDVVIGSAPASIALQQAGKALVLLHSLLVGRSWVMLGHLQHRAHVGGWSTLCLLYLDGLAGRQVVRAQVVLINH